MGTQSHAAFSCFSTKTHGGNTGDTKAQSHDADGAHQKNRSKPQEQQRKKMGSVRATSTSARVPSATPGDFVFVQVGKRRGLAIVDSFDGTRYVVRPRVARSLPPGPDGTLVLTVAPPTDGQPGLTVMWSNAPTPTCCVCFDDESSQQQPPPSQRMAVLACRCSAPIACTTCARTIPACPQCRTRLYTLPAGVISVARLETPVDASSAVRLTMVSLAGKRYEITASPSWSVRTLKAFYAHVAGAHPKQQTLKCAGTSLDNDDRDLGSYGIANGQTIHVILDLAGD
ncbi:ubiquitin-like domain protein [Pandoravirus inopinatum]|uniref:Ubiquitin-like domain protein n=1 Tax=Pandoravirus inopinatum TaxID=1605721 RepID=A0A0B5IZP4_9VIRU|nr:ubiquitin-like domain protein [Pandoravirus inopinatum]AJF98408.1 ubiquitin-like domain protein [Pandoravirus inopinatum]